MSVFNYIEINGTKIIRPNDFTLKREDVYAGEYTTCTGKVIADRIGWRYAESEMKWGTLPQEQLEVLLAMSSACTLTFTDADGEHTETVVPTTRVLVSTRSRDTAGRPLWSGVTLGVKFINVHN